MLKIIDNRVSDSVLTFMGHAAYFCSQGCKEKGIIHKPMIYFHFCGANSSFQCRTQGKPRGVFMQRGCRFLQSEFSSPNMFWLSSSKRETKPCERGPHRTFLEAFVPALWFSFGMAHCFEQSSVKKMPIRVWVYFSIATPVIAVFGCISGIWE